MAYIILILSALYILLAIYGIVSCIRNCRIILLLISLAGIAGAVICLVLIRFSLSAYSASEAGFCGTSAIDELISAAETYGPWMVVSLIVSGVGGWASLFTRRRTEKVDAFEPDFPIPGKEE